MDLVKHVPQREETSRVPLRCTRATGGNQGWSWMRRDMKTALGKAIKGRRKYYVIKRIFLIILILLIGGGLYSLAGARHEWGDVPIMGVLLTAILFPWEWLFWDKFK
ncbi:MAG: hypothetical protein ABW068_12310 [Candidatus Thiodiazotropha sp.]